MDGFILFHSSLRRDKATRQEGVEVLRSEEDSPSKSDMPDFPIGQHGIQLPGGDPKSGSGFDT